MMKFLKSLRLFQVLYIITLTVSAAILGGFLENFSFNYFYTLLLKMFLLISLWEFTVVVNNIFDENEDRATGMDTPITLNLISKKLYLRLGFLFLLISFFFGVLLKNFILIILIFIAIVLNFLYSVPPFRFKKYGVKSFFIGIGSVIVFLIGYSGDYTTSIFHILILLFFSVSIGTIVADLKDFEGDKKYGIKTLFTVFGIEKGKKIASVFLFLSFLMPLYLFHSPLDIILFLTLGIFSVFIFMKSEEYRPIIFFVALIFFYCALRLTGCVVF